MEVWLKIDLLETQHLRLAVKIAREVIFSELPVSMLVRRHKIFLKIKTRKLAPVRERQDPPLLVIEESLKR